MNEQIKQRIEQLNNGEVPKGYKKTEIGVFPSDWVTDKTLGDLFDFYGGLSKSRDELGEEGYAYLHYGDLHRGTFNTVSIKHYEQLPKCDILLTGKEKCLMKDGDVAFLDASEDLEGTSRAVLIDNPENKPFIAGLHIIYGKAKNNSLDKWFKQYITSSESVKKQFQRLAVGFKVYGVNRDTIPRIKVAFPSSNKEQSRIAEILMKWDEAVELYDKQIDALTRYKAVCLRKMFPAKGQNVPEWRFRGFTDAWEQRKLSDLIEENLKPIPKPDKEYVRLGIRSHAKGTFHEVVAKGAGLDVDTMYVVEADNLIVNITFAWEEAWAITSREDAEKLVSHRFPQYRFHQGQYPMFFQYRFRNGRMKYNLELASPGGAGRNRVLNKTEFLKIPVIIPTSYKEEKQIGEYFQSLDNLITLHQRKKEAITNQRKTLQQYLLNGIIRV